MKKMIMAALVLAAGVFGVEAQSLSPRVEVGAAFSSMSFKVSDPDMKLGVRAGAALEIGLTDPGMVNVYLAPGLTYKMGGYKNPVDANGHLTTHNISVPVSFGMRAGFASSMAASVEVGPYFSYVLSGCMAGYDLFSYKKDSKRFDAGIGVSAALEYSKFYLRLGTEFGFLNQFGEANLADGKNKNFYTTLGFRF